MDATVGRDNGDLIAITQRAGQPTLILSRRVRRAEQARVRTSVGLQVRILIVGGQRRTDGEIGLLGKTAHHDARVELGQHLSPVHRRALLRRARAVHACADDIGVHHADELIARIRLPVDQIGGQGEITSGARFRDRFTENANAIVGNLLVGLQLIHLRGRVGLFIGQIRLIEEQSQINRVHADHELGEYAGALGIGPLGSRGVHDTNLEPLIGHGLIGLTSRGHGLVQVIPWLAVRPSALIAVVDGEARFGGDRRQRIGDIGAGHLIRKNRELLDRIGAVRACALGDAPEGAP